MKVKTERKKKFVKLPKKKTTDELNVHSKVFLKIIKINNKCEKKKILDLPGVCVYMCVVVLRVDCRSGCYNWNFLIKKRV